MTGIVQLLKVYRTSSPVNNTYGKHRIKCSSLFEALINMTHQDHWSNTHRQYEKC